MRIARALGLCSTAVAGAALAAPATGPTAVYWMSASTTSGLGGMAASMAGGGRPSMSAMMAMGRGFDPNAASKTLVLQLGSSQRPQGAPNAEHDPPDGLGAGPTLPLVTPQVQAAHTEETPSPSVPQQYQRPHGRMLIFWGCGEHAGAGQPVVIDFATLGQGAGAQRLMSMARGAAITSEQPPSPGRDATYGEWPNGETRVSIPATGSLAGAHTVRGNYSPTLQFSLGAGQDFLDPLVLTTNQKNPSGSASLVWNPVGRAQGYFATMFGAGQGGDQIVMWTSSASQQTAFALPQFLPDGDIRRLVAAAVLMPASQTSCIIPQEAMAAAGRGGFFTLAGYGGEYDIAYPPRPPAPRAWNILWTLKVRYRSSTSGIVGVDLGRRGAPEQSQAPQKKPSRSSIFLQGLGSVVP